MFIRRSLLAAFLLSAVALPQAFANFEVRGGIGLISADDDSFDDDFKAATGGDSLTIDDFDTLNADLFYTFPNSPLGLGVRYDWWQQDKSGSVLGVNSNWDINVNNVAALVDVRIIDTPSFYVGPIFSVGYPWADLEYNVGGSAGDSTLKPDGISYSAAGEIGFYVGPLLIGAEAGYMSMKFEDSDDGPFDISADFSGFYGKALAGIRFGPHDEK